MLTPFDDYPIHPSADPVAHTATGDPNHYDRYFFNGHHKDGDFFIGGAMGHYPNRGVVDAAFAIVADGVEHSVFASGRMPLDRSTEIGPIKVEVVKPLRGIRIVVGENESGITADILFKATTEALEEPRQTRFTEDGVMVMDNTRLTQWGRWEGEINLKGEKITVQSSEVTGTRDRSWGVRPVGKAVETNRPPRTPHVFWLWAPLHFDDICTHLALHENPDGTRWLQSAFLVPPLADPEADYKVGASPEPEEMNDIQHQIEWEPGTREMKSASLFMIDKSDNKHVVDFEKLYTFRMRGIGYTHPEWSHGSNHGELAVGFESIPLNEFDPEDFSSLHIQTLCKVTYGDRKGIGVLEQFAAGDHEPAGLKGITTGFGK